MPPKKGGGAKGGGDKKEDKKEKGGSGGTAVKVRESAEIEREATEYYVYLISTSSLAKSREGSSFP